MRRRELNKTAATPSNRPRLVKRPSHFQEDDEGRAIDEGGLHLGGGERDRDQAAWGRPDAIDEPEHDVQQASQVILANPSIVVSFETPGRRHRFVLCQMTQDADHIEHVQ